MGIASKVSLGIMFLAVACAPADKALAPPAAPDFAGKPQDVACKAKDLKAVQKGKITANDCLFNGTQRENLYRADQQALGLPDFSGSHMLVFEQDAEVDGIYGISDWDDTRFGDPVFGYQTFAANDPSRSFAVIGSDPEYKLFFSGADETQLGKYTLTTSVATSANSCETGRRTFLQGNVAFSSAITDATSCAGVVEFDPYVGQPLNYQFWYAKLTAGQDVTVHVDGIDGDDPSVTLAVIVFGSPFAQLDFSSGAGDTNREISFTAPFDGYYYVEVSSSPGVSSPYHLTFTSE